DAGEPPPRRGTGQSTHRPPPTIRRGCATRRREGCESGRIGTLGKRVWGNPPWVRIPLPPQTGLDAAVDRCRILIQSSSTQPGGMSSSPCRAAGPDRGGRCADPDRELQPRRTLRGGIRELERRARSRLRRDPGTRLEGLARRPRRGDLRRRVHVRVREGRRRFPPVVLVRGGRLDTRSSEVLGPSLRRSRRYDSSTPWCCESVAHVMLLVTS